MSHGACEHAAGNDIGGDELHDKLLITSSVSNHHYNSSNDKLDDGFNILNHKRHRRHHQKNMNDSRDASISSPIASSTIPDDEPCSLLSANRRRFDSNCSQNYDAMSTLPVGTHRAEHQQHKCDEKFDFTKTTRISNFDENREKVSADFIKKLPCSLSDVETSTFKFVRPRDLLLRNKPANDVCRQSETDKCFHSSTSTKTTTRTKTRLNSEALNHRRINIFRNYFGNRHKFSPNPHYRAEEALDGFEQKKPRILFSAGGSLFSALIHVIYCTSILYLFYCTHHGRSKSFIAQPTQLNENDTVILIRDHQRLFSPEPQVRLDTNKLTQKVLMRNRSRKVLVTPNFPTLSYRRDLVQTH